MTTPTICEDRFRIKFPSSILVVGPSNCGKTTFMKKLLLENLDLFEVPPNKIVYCYGSWQPTFDLLKKHGVEFHEGVPDLDFLQKKFAGKQEKGGVLIMDDLMSKGGDDETVMNIFTQHSHHMGFVAFYLCQDMFPKGKYCTTISRNAQYIIAFKNPRDNSALRAVLLQMYPTEWRNVMATINNASEKLYGYFIFDLHPRTRNKDRLLSNLLKHEGCIRMYRKPET